MGDRRGPGCQCPHPRRSAGRTASHAVRLAVQRGNRGRAPSPARPAEARLSRCHRGGRIRAPGRSAGASPQPERSDSRRHPAPQIMTSSIFMATSLDGFIARPDDALDWLPASGGKEHGYSEFIAAEDAIVMGHRTFEKVLTFGAWPFGKKQVTVLSTKPSGVAVPAGAVCEAMAGKPSA